MKFCPKCNKHKSDDEFAKRLKDKLCSYCKVCQREYSKRHYSENKDKHNKRRYENTKITRKEQRERLNKLKDNKPCVDCGVKYPYYVLEFDHLKNKIANVSDMVGRFGWEKIENEIKKCDIICSNCHKIRTHNRRQKQKLSEYS